MYKSFYLTLFLVFISSFIFGQHLSKVYLFAGSYTSGKKAKGIAVYSFNEETGRLTRVEREDNLINPSFLTLSSNGKFLYACTETKLEKNGSVSAFKIDSLTGRISFLNKQSTGGRNPVHLTIDKTNNYIIASNYTDAGISLFKCNPDGSIRPFTTLIEFEGGSIIEGRQDQAHIHSCNFSPDNQYIFAPDLGADKIRVLAFNSENQLMVLDQLTVHTTKGSGPRHFTFHPNARFAYCLEELSGTISSYSYLNGKLNKLNTHFSYKEKQEEYAASDIHISPDGKFLYASNRQEEHSISIFNIDQTNGELTHIANQSTYGSIPRSFVISPSGSHLIVANQISNEIIVFKRDLETGLLKKRRTKKRIKSPSSLKMIEYKP